MRIVVDVDSAAFKSMARPFSEWARHLLESVVLLNRVQLRTGIVGPLYRSGVFYQREEPGVESFACASTVAKRGFGDCAHLAAWLAAEYQEQGDEEAHVFIKWFPKSESGRLFHVLVKRGNGTVEDPSKVLGM